MMDWRMGYMSRIFFFSSRRRHTRCSRDWSSDVCSSDLFRAVSHRRSAVRGQQSLRALSRPSAQSADWSDHSYLSAAFLRLSPQPHSELDSRGALRSLLPLSHQDRKSTRLNSSHGYISYAVFCLKKKKLT